MMGEVMMTVVIREPRAESCYFGTSLIVILHGWFWATP